jgi:hypothetical protein
MTVKKMKAMRVTPMATYQTLLSAGWDGSISRLQNKVEVLRG